MKKVHLGILCILASLFLIACTTGSDTTRSDEQAVVDPPLAKAYQNIIFQDFSAAPEVVADYPTAMEECRGMAISTLKTKGRYKTIGDVGQQATGGGSTLLVKAYVPTMRIVSGSARFWGGALAGSSDMVLDLEFIDAASGQVVRKKQISSANNPFGAAWTGGSSDRSLPADMGGILAEYILATVPAP